MKKNRTFHHLFLMDPLEKLDFKLDTSLKLARQLRQRGDKIFYTTYDQLYWQKNQETASCYYRELVCLPHSIEAGKERATAPLSHFHAIHMRLEPPFDIRYITCTWFLDTVNSQCRIYNAPHGLRSINEKFSILRYQDYIDPCLITYSAEEGLAFIETHCHGDAIIKPLDEYGGHGIERFQCNQPSAISYLARLQEKLEQKKPILIQPFNPAIFDGEVRCFCVGGQPLAWCKKIPAPGSFMANSSFGSTRRAHSPSHKEINMATHIAQDLLKLGISIVGFDFIGEKLSEINVTSPRLLQGDDDTHDYYSEFARWLVSDLSSSFSD